MINIRVIQADGIPQEFAIPNDIGISLMECLKIFQLEISPVCGGKGVCGGCCVEIDHTPEPIEGPGPVEQRILEKTCTRSGNIRLSCQMEVIEQMEGMIIKTLPDV